MGHPRYAAGEIGRIGKEIYERQIKDKVEAAHRDKYLVLDIETGEYEVGDDYLALSERMLARRPEAPLFGMRVGHRALGRIGARAEVARA